jgi:hypothetical protein
MDCGLRIAECGIWNGEPFWLRRNPDAPSSVRTFGPKSQIPACGRQAKSEMRRMRIADCGMRNLEAVFQLKSEMKN